MKGERACIAIIIYGTFLVTIGFALVTINNPILLLGWPMFIIMWVYCIPNLWGLSK